MDNDKKGKFEEALDELDRDCFHVYKELNENGEISKWSIYYRNMSDEDYLSKYNTAILDSENNNINDIIELKKSFDRKIKIAKNHTIWERIKVMNYIFDFTSLIGRDVTKLSMIECVLTVIFMLFIGTCLDGEISSILNLIVLILYVINLLTLDYLYTKILKESDKTRENIDNVVIKNELKYRKGNLYEFKKKNRKNSTKKIQQARYKKTNF